MTDAKDSIPFVIGEHPALHLPNYLLDLANSLSGVIASHSIIRLGQFPQPLIVVSANEMSGSEFLNPTKTRLEVLLHRLPLFVVTSFLAERSEVPSITSKDAVVGFPLFAEGEGGI